MHQWDKIQNTNEKQQHLTTELAIELKFLLYFIWNKSHFSFLVIAVFIVDIYMLELKFYQNVWGSVIGTLLVNMKVLNTFGIQKRYKLQSVSNRISVEGDILIFWKEIAIVQSVKITAPSENDTDFLVCFLGNWVQKGLTVVSHQTHINIPDNVIQEPLVNTKRSPDHYSFTLVVLWTLGVCVCGWSPRALVPAFTATSYENLVALVRLCGFCKVLLYLVLLPRWQIIEDWSNLREMKRIWFYFSHR